LCRPTQLEQLDAYDFFSQYEVVRRTARNRDQLLYFTNDRYQHPSYRQSSNCFLQGVKARERQHLIKVFQYDFPDTAVFGGSILDANVAITSDMETYSKLVLLLFLPLRTMSDIQLNGSFTQRLRYAVQSGEVGNKAIEFLQNMQDCRSNATRVGRIKDDLQRVTTPFKPADDAFDEMSNDEEANEQDEVDGALLDEFLRMYDAEADSTIGADTTQPGSASSETLPSTHSLKVIRQKGVLKCGYESLAPMNVNHAADEQVLQQQRQGERASACIMMTMTVRTDRQTHMPMAAGLVLMSTEEILSTFCCSECQDGNAPLLK
jgi:hypothetical protein